MNKNIEQALSGFSYDEQRRMRDVITALDNGKVYSVEFFPMVRVYCLNTIIRPSTTDAPAHWHHRSARNKQ